MEKKASRRTYGTGSVFEIKTGPKAGQWQGRAEVPGMYTRSGGRKRISVFAPTKRKAEQKIAKKIDDLVAGKLKLEYGYTVKDWIESEWLPRYEQVAAPSTFKNARSNVNRWIIPIIGRLKLHELTGADIRNVYDAMREAGCGESTVLRCHGVMSIIWSAAEREGIEIKRSVIVVEKPRRTKPESKHIPTAQAMKLLATAATRKDRARWVAALLQGMRPSEVLGLTWDCVDFENGLIDVQWQLQALPFKDRDAGTFRVPRNFEARQLIGAWHLTRPKTEAGRRFIPMVPWMMAELRRLHADPNNKNPHNLVFWREAKHPNRRGTPIPINDKLDREAFQSLQEEAGVADENGKPYTIYSTRHTTATLLLEAGISEAVVKAIMGHTSINTTRIYQHVTRELAREALLNIATTLGIEDDVREIAPRSQN